MDFVKYISTPVGRDVSNPLITTMKLTRGRLSGGFLYYPSGAAGNLHFLARIGVHQVLPFNTGQDFQLDDCVIRFSLGIDLLEPPYYIDCVTWNESTTYAHALTVCFFLNPLKDDKRDLNSLISEFASTEGYEKS